VHSGNATDERGVMHTTIVQLTDCHLFGDESAYLYGVNTEKSYQAVLQLIREECPKIDLLLATGDIAHDGSRQAYRRFVSGVEQIATAVSWLPGNHDSIDVMTTCSDRSLLAKKAIDLGNWCVLLLDSHIEGELRGRLAEEELQFLQNELNTTDAEHVLISMHHHPASINSPWLDPHRVENGESLFAVVDRFPSVRVILFGHVHQQFECTRKGVRLMGAPSTCCQFVSGMRRPPIDDKLPGYRWLRLSNSGEVESGISRVTDVQFKPDLEQVSGQRSKRDDKA
jgi:Icc protein|tara:strand:+ start:2648 stop:3496 length:849 start_codon:yes stop_codon:yes gene_type:complete